MFCTIKPIRFLTLFVLSGQATTQPFPHPKSANENESPSDRTRSRAASSISLTEGPWPRSMPSSLPRCAQSLKTSVACFMGLRVNTSKKASKATSSSFTSIDAWGQNPSMMSCIQKSNHMPLECYLSQSDIPSLGNVQATPKESPLS